MTARRTWSDIYFGYGPRSNGSNQFGPICCRRLVMDRYQACDRVPMPCQHNVLAIFSPTDEIGQSCLCLCYCKLHVRPLRLRQTWTDRQSASSI